MVVICYIKLFCTAGNRHNSIWMSLLLLITETKNKVKKAWGYKWDCHSSKTRPSLVKPHCNASPKTKDCRVDNLKIEWANSISVRNWGYLWGRHTQRQYLHWKSPFAWKQQQKKKKNQDYFRTKKAYKLLRPLPLKTTFSLQENHWFVVTSFVIA